MFICLLDDLLYKLLLQQKFKELIELPGIKVTIDLKNNTLSEADLEELKTHQRLVLIWS